METIREPLHVNDHMKGYLAVASRPSPPPPPPPPLSNPQNYVLKVTGRESYIHGSYELIQFSYVVYSLSKKQDVELALVKKLDPDNDQLRSIPDVSFDVPWFSHVFVMWLSCDLNLHICTCSDIYIQFYLESVEKKYDLDYCFVCSYFI